MQMRSSVFNIDVLVLTRPALRGEDAASVDIFKITIRKFVVPLGFCRLLIIDPQIPFCVLPQTVCRKELIFRLRGGPVLVRPSHRTQNARAR
jgi:hypothetical protein